MTVVKVCGLRRATDAERAVARGARFVGCVLAADSPRRASLGEARSIVDAVGQRAGVVLVFRRPTIDEVRRAVDLVGVSRVQPHGVDEATLASLAAHGLDLHRVVSIDALAAELPSLPPAGPDVPGVLDVGRGGSGTAFDWGLLANGSPDGYLIAGGITPDNVADLLRRRPFGIDVSSGLESAPGIKDPRLLDALFDAVNALP